MGEEFRRRDRPYVSQTEDLLDPDRARARRTACDGSEADALAALGSIDFAAARARVMAPREVDASSSRACLRGVPSLKSGLMTADSYHKQQEELMTRERKSAEEERRKDPEVKRSEEEQRRLEAEKKDCDAATRSEQERAQRLQAKRQQLAAPQKSSSAKGAGVKKARLSFDEDAGSGDDSDA
mmetsp:Transcript_98323/g.249551  ORF Transcript_98323/g.249551 Transcript_98323/m.249551 type:complete len:183 (+) Transcript_98323:106-654(+)